jgi:sugar phosphate isomerase/epimerase
MKMKIALCNEVLGQMPFAEQCVYAKSLGYDGLEVAPFTLSDAPHRLSAAERARVRRAADEAGVSIIGLHWLLVAPKGLSITAPEAAVRQETVEVLRHLIDLCADLGGSVMVHGSPAQRAVAPGDTLAAAWDRARDCWAQIAEHAAAAGVTYCLEPLAKTETQLINTLEEAARMVGEVGHPAVRSMIDTCSAGRTETLGVAELIDKWLPTGLVRHVQVNDSNRRGPGQGADRFAPVFAALQRNGYDGVVSVEPFEYLPDGPATAARAIGYIRGILEAQAAKVG